MAARPNLLERRAAGRGETSFRLGMDSARNRISHSSFGFKDRRHALIHSVNYSPARPPPFAFFGSIPFHSGSPECRRKKGNCSYVLAGLANRMRRPPRFCRLHKGTTFTREQKDMCDYIYVCHGGFTGPWPELCPSCFGFKDQYRLLVHSTS